MNVAQGWTETSTETVVAEIVTLATAGIPGASLFDTLIASQIADFLEWEYSDPVEVSEGIYRVTTTVQPGYRWTCRCWAPRLTRQDYPLT